MPTTDRMMTRSRLTPNGDKSKTSESHQNNIQIQYDALTTRRDSVRDELKEIFMNQEEKVISNLELSYANKKITFEQYNEEMDKLNKTITDLHLKMKELDLNIDQQDKKIENITIEASIQNKENQETFDRIEKDSKLNQNEILNVRRTASDNRFEINDLKKTQSRPTY